MKRRPHVSWLLAVGSVGIIFGAAVSLWISTDVYSSALAACSALSAVAGLAARSRVSIAILLVAGVCFGLWRGSSVRVSHDMYTRWLGETVEMTGRIAEDPDFTDRGVQFLVEKPAVEGVATNGLVWVRTSEAKSLKRSYEISVRGKLTDGFGTIPATLYDAEVVSVSEEKYPDKGRDMRDWFAAGIGKAITGPEGQLGSGILLGQKSSLPEQLEQELLVLGLTHIVVASGYNLTILVKIARKLVLPISRFTALAASGLLIVGFLTITGLSPSMVRASLVAGLSLATWYFGRKTHPVVLLSFAGGITVVFNPTYAWGDLGWLLSFLSFTGVLIVAPLIHAYFWGQKQPRLLRGVLVETVAAQIMTLPLLVYIFERYSPLSVLANALVVPSIPIVMAFIFVAGAAGVVAAPLAWIFGLPARLALLYYTRSSELLASISFAQQEMRVQLWAVFLSYCAGVFAIVWLWIRTGYDFRNRLEEWI